MKRRRLPKAGHIRAAYAGVVQAPGSASPKSDLLANWMIRFVVLFSVTLLVYGPALRGQFLWDDDQHVTRPDLESLDGLWRIWSDLKATQQYYPLLHSMFWVEHRIWGDAVLGYHLTNVALHSLSALLVILIVQRLKLPGGWLAGLLFALHPVGVESVAWITEQKNTLSGVFYLASTLIYLHFDQTRRKSRYFLALLLFVLALLSKSALAALPAILLVLVWMLHGRLEWRRDIRPLLPWFAVALSFGLVTYYVETVYLGAGPATYSLSLPERLLLASRVLWFYASKVLLPVGLVFSYPRWKVDLSAWWQYLFPAGLLVLVVVLVFLARRNRGPLAAFLVFAGALFPVLGLLNVFYFRYSYVADHFQYLACIAILVPAAVGLARLFGRPDIRRWRGISCVVLLVSLGAMTRAQSADYRDLETLYRSILARNPDSWLAHNNLGMLLVQQPGRIPEAVAEYRAAIRIQPAYPEAHFNLGSALAHMEPQKQQPEALREYQTAIRLRPDYPQAHYNLANFLAQMPGRLPEAIVEYQRALELDPKLAEAHANLGNALAQMPDRMPDAIKEYETALRLNPGLTMQRINLANALAQMPGRLPEAISQYEAALEAEPNFAEGHFLLARALSEIPGRLADAIAECEAALRIDPSFEPAQELLKALQTIRK
jgi:protein O-mannosyl-transferase